MESDANPKPESSSNAGDEVEQAKSKLIMDFGLAQKAPERVTIEVLQQLIREKPQRMTQIVRKWMRS